MVLKFSFNYQINLFFSIENTVIRGYKESQKEASNRDSLSNFDWSISQNDDDDDDSSMDSMSDYDDFDPKVKKLDDDDLKPQPVLRKSKKVF